MPTIRTSAIASSRSAGRTSQMNGPDSELASLCILDVKILKALTKELAPQAVHNYLRLFLSDSTARLEEIRAVASAEDTDEVACLSHDLVSTAGNIGAIQMSCAARALARACRNNDRKRAREFLNDLAVATYASCLEVQKWLNAAETSVHSYAGPDRRRIAKNVGTERRKGTLNPAK